jgi:hypothetical protein
MEDTPEIGQTVTVTLIEGVKCSAVVCEVSGVVQQTSEWDADTF